MIYKKGVTVNILDTNANSGATARLTNHAKNWTETATRDVKTDIGDLDVN